MTETEIIEWLKDARDCLLDYAQPGEMLTSKHVHLLIPYFQSGWTPAAAAEAVQASGGGFRAQD